MLNRYLIFLYVLLPFIAMSFWESSAEGRHAWDKGKVGWKLKIGKYVVTHRYHFWANVMIFLFVFMPLVIYGWDLVIFGVLLSAYSFGFVVEDFGWYVVNPVVKIKELNTNFANYYPRVNVFGIKIPTGYFIGIILAFLSWFFIWR